MIGDINSLDELTSKGWFDSRDVQAAIEWWADVAESSAEREMLDALNAFKTEVCNAIGEAEWDAGITLMSGDESFRDYIRDRDQELRPGTNFNESPFSHIDWDAVAKDALSDYSTVEFNGVTIYHENR